MRVGCGTIAAKVAAFAAIIKTASKMITDAENGLNRVSVKTIRATCCAFAKNHVEFAILVTCAKTTKATVAIHGLIPDNAQKILDS